MGQGYHVRRYWLSSWLSLVIEVKLKFRLRDEASSGIPREALLVKFLVSLVVKVRLRFRLRDEARAWARDTT